MKNYKINCISCDNELYIVTEGDFLFSEQNYGLANCPNCQKTTQVNIDDEIDFNKFAKIAYTVGTYISYDLALAESTIEKPVKKLGRSSDYKGGCVWLNKKDAYTYINADKIMIDGTKRDNKKFAVYEIRLPNNWATDVSKEIDDCGVHMLLVDAIITRKV